MRLRAAAGVVGLTLALGSCTGDGQSGQDATNPPSGDPSIGASSRTPAVTASPSATASPEPTSTLTPAQQQAFDEATAAVLAYRQTITDLYSGARTDLNDLNDVATGDLLDQGLINISKSLGQGWRREPRGARLDIVSAIPVKIALGADPPLMIVSVCIDASAVTLVSPAGTEQAGVREELNYRVIKADYLPNPGWAVARVTSSKPDGERTC